jgi:hypothetical protein
MQKLSLERVKKFTWVNFCERMIEEVKEFKNAKA